MILLLAAACGGAGNAPDRVLSAAAAATEDAPAPSSTVTSTSTTAAPATTTEKPVPVTTAAPRTTVVRRAPTTRAPVTSTPPIAGYSPAPPPPGVQADGYGGYGGVTRGTTGPVEIELSVYPREQYLGEIVQVAARVSHPESVAITSIRIDFGNGHVVSGSQGLGWYCGPQTQDAGAGAWYTYPAPGTFRITATATFVACMGVPGMWIGPYFPPPAGLQGPWFPEPHQAVTAGMDMLQRPDRPPRPVGPPPGP